MKTVDYIVEQIAGAGPVSARPMFGEYGLYCDGKMIAIIGEDQLFMRMTAAGRVLADGAAEVSPYPGSRPYLRIDADLWKDADWLAQMARATAAETPAQRRRSPRKPKTPA